LVDFPVGVGGVLPVLQRAAAARAEMGAGGRLAIGGGGEDLRGAGPALTALGELCRADDFTWERVGEVRGIAVRERGQAVAVGAQLADFECVTPLTPTLSRKGRGRRERT
jgi:hypothetical protein